MYVLYLLAAASVSGSGSSYLNIVYAVMMKNKDQTSCDYWIEENDEGKIKAAKCSDG